MSVKNRNSIVTDGLVFYVDAGNEDSYPGSATTWSDLIGSNDGTLTNGPVYSSSNAGFLDFDGTDDYVAHSDIGASDWPVTLSAWVKFDVNNVAQTVVSQADTSAINQMFGCATQMTGSNMLATVWTYSASYGYKDARGTTPLATGTWYHLTAVFESNTSKKIYLNGNLEATLTDSTTFPTGIDNLNIARFGRSTPGGYVNGQIACAMAYNKALSASEILQNYNALKNRFI